MTNSLIPLFAIIAPFLVWPIELILPYPHVVEEIAKGILVYHGHFRPKQALLVGAIFAFSEAVFYSLNSPFAFSRLMYTLPLHAGTSLVMALTGRKLWPLGLAAAVLLHWLYNKFAGYPSLPGII